MKGRAAQSLGEERTDLAGPREDRGACRRPKERRNPSRFNPFPALAVSAVAQAHSVLYRSAEGAALVTRAPALGAWENNPPLPVRRSGCSRRDHA